MGGPKRYPIFYIKGSGETPTPCNYKDALIGGTLRLMSGE